METKKNTVLGLLAASAILSGLGAFGAASAGEKGGSVDERLERTVRIEVRAQDDSGKPLEPIVVGDAKAVGQIVKRLTAVKTYTGEPAGWLHTTQIDFVTAKGERLTTYTFGGWALDGTRTVFMSLDDGERLLPGALCKLLQPHVLAAEQAAKQAAKRKKPGAKKSSLVGEWEGKVVFTKGLQARARVELSADPKGGFVGTYTLREQGEHGLGKPQTARVSARLDGERVSLRVAGQTYRARLGGAGSHAERALYGTFSDEKQGEGVFVLWRYKKR